MTSEETPGSPTLRQPSEPESLRAEPITGPAVAQAGTSGSGAGTIFLWPPGALLANRYRIEASLGSGGFGTVYLARDTNLYNKQVVIKTLLESRQASEWAGKKFKQECEALARIDHPGVVRVLDRGATPDGRELLVMSFIEGVTLRSLITRSPDGMDLRFIAALIRQIGQALRAAHDAGVQHRDLKPENIMIRDLGTGLQLPVIIDFGIAGVTDSTVSSATAGVVGSLPYMAPEHLDGKPEAASDIYALGVVTFEMVTGSRPFQADSQVDLYRKQAQGPKHHPCELRLDLPASAGKAILKALAFRAGDRYGCATDFAVKFESCVTGSAAPQLPPQRLWRMIAMLASGLVVVLLLILLLKS